MKRALVTGGSGFLGEHLQTALRAKGWEVECAGRADVARIDQTAAWRFALAAARPDAIFHLLGTADAPDESHFDAAHFHPTRALLQAMFDLGLVATPVFVLGSAAEYGGVPEDRQPIKETEPSLPLTAYGRSKFRASEVAFAFAERGVRAVVVRLFNVFARTMPAKLMPGTILAQLREGAAQIRVRNLEEVRDFLQAEVAMESLARLAKCDLAGGAIVNLCSGCGLRISEIVHAMLRAVGRENDLYVEAKENSERSSGTRRSVGDNTRLKNLLGFAPRVPTLDDFAGLVAGVD